LHAAREATLPAFAARTPECSRTEFLCWLSDRAAAAEVAGSPAQADELGSLVGRLLALADTWLEREGAARLAPAGTVQPAASASASASAASSAAAAERLSLALAAGAQAVDGEALAQRWAALAWWGEAEGADGLPVQAARSRLDSATQLLGRTPLRPEQAARAYAPSAEERILAALLAVGREALREAVADALTPAEDAGGDDDEQEMLATTPLRLLQTVDHALGQLARGGPPPPGVAGALPPGAGAEEALRASRDETVRLL
jgi:hypothetical protein